MTTRGERTALGGVLLATGLTVVGLVVNADDGRWLSFGFAGALAAAGGAIIVALAWLPLRRIRPLRRRAPKTRLEIVPAPPSHQIRQIEDGDPPLIRYEFTLTVTNLSDLPVSLVRVLLDGTNDGVVTSRYVDPTGTGLMGDDDLGDPPTLRRIGEPGEILCRFWERPPRSTESGGYTTHDEYSYRPRKVVFIDQFGREHRTTVHLASEGN